MDPRITRLLETGLRHFALGELDLAVGSWRAVLELDPNNERALGYLRLLQAEAPAPPQAPTSDHTGDAFPWFDGEDAVVGGEEPLDALDCEPGPVPAPAPAAAASWFDLDPQEAPAERFGLELELDLAQTGPLRDPAGTDGPRAPPRVPPPTDLLLGAWAETIPAAEEEAELDLLEVDEIAPWESPGGGSDALGLLDESFPPPPVAVPRVLPQQPPAASRDREADTLMQGARELFELGDFSGSLGLVQKALALEPGHPEALDYLERNQDTLIQMYESKLGPLDARPRVVLRPDEIVWLNLDHRAGFVLSQIDGTVSIDDLYAVCGLSRLDTAKILAELVEQGVMTT